MAQSYPATKSKMGSWEYFTCQIPMGEVASLIKREEDFYKKNAVSLNEVLQREVEVKRVKKDIVSYLSNRGDRFFSAIVVGTLGGSPVFQPLKVESMKDDPHLQYFVNHFKDIEVGVLSFDSHAEMYALDGQHRLSAIMELIDGEDHDFSIPDGFKQEMLTVIFVPLDDNDEQVKREKYRRLFSSLNRYAKKTDQKTNILMDEDDFAAILTRRLIQTHDGFSFSTENNVSSLVNTDQKSDSMNPNQAQFTNLITLYKINQNLLKHSIERVFNEKQKEIERVKYIKGDYARQRPSDEHLDLMYDQLEEIWTVLFNIFPEIQDAKTIETRDLNNKEEAHLLFFPVCQTDIFAELIDRILREKCSIHARKVEGKEIQENLMILTKIPFLMREKPWVNFLCQFNRETDKWNITARGKTSPCSIAVNLILYICGFNEWNEQQIDEWKEKYKKSASETLKDEDINKVFEELINLRIKLSSGT